jgi:hypothetical protein
VIILSAPQYVYRADPGTPGLSMPAEPTEKPSRKRETWRDWVLPGFVVPDDEELITREELLGQLQTQGVEVDVDDLRNWQTQGVIPYGERVWHKETGRTRVVYPTWMVPVLAQLRHLQGKGKTLQDIGLDLRATAILRTGHYPHVHFLDWSTAGDLAAVLEAIAATYEQHVGRRVASIETRFELAPAGEGGHLVVQVLDERGARFTTTANLH